MTMFEYTQEHKMQKQRVTFYASKATLETLQSLMEARGDNSMTGVINQVILQYSELIKVMDLEKRVAENAEKSVREIGRLETEIDVLNERLSVVEARHAKIRRFQAGDVGND